MKKIFLFFFLSSFIGMWAQTPVVKQEQLAPQSPAPNPSVQRPNHPSVRVETSTPAKMPYDVNDKYMGRTNEFLSSMIVNELPADFPVYDKKWGVPEYNAVIDTYFMSHMEILKDRVKEKIQSLIDNQKNK